MITRQDVCQVYDALALAEVLNFCQHSLEVFDQVKWDGHHWKQVVHVAQHQAWDDMKDYIDCMGETYLREHMQNT